MVNNLVFLVISGAVMVSDQVLVRNLMVSNLMLLVISGVVMVNNLVLLISNLWYCHGQ